MKRTNSRTIAKESIVLTDAEKRAAGASWSSLKLKTPELECESGAGVFGENSRPAISQWRRWQGALTVRRKRVTEIRLVFAPRSREAYSK